jgi:hypothetical protein
MDNNSPPKGRFYQKERVEVKCGNYERGGDSPG